MAANRPRPKPGRGPAEIDFNALWDRGYVPVIKALGYEPVRADQDTGALIVGQMLERLYFADLVLADMTIPNGNVYYEVGIRHAAQKTGCVLLAADWSKQLFDVVQMRTIRYPLAEGNITDSRPPPLSRPRSRIISWRSVTGSRRCTSRSRAIQPMSIRARRRRREISWQSLQHSRPRCARYALRRLKSACNWRKGLVASEGNPPATYPIALALLLLLRDSANTAANWNVVLDFVRNLPNQFADEPEIQENRAFAAAQAGNDIQAIAELETLIDMVGPTPERLGLMGGRYKRLANAPRRPKRNGGKPSTRRSTIMNEAWSSISTPIIAPATCRASIERARSRVTMNARRRP